MLYCIPTLFYYCLFSNGKMVSHLVPGQVVNKFANRIRPPYFFDKKQFFLDNFRHFPALLALFPPYLLAYQIWQFFNVYLLAYYIDTF